MPTNEGGIIRYDVNNPEDLAALIENGLIWKGGPQAINKAIQAVLTGAVPRPTRNVPAQVNAIFDQNMPPQPGEPGA